LSLAGLAVIFPCIVVSDFFLRAECGAHLQHNPVFVGPIQRSRRRHDA